MSESCTRTKYSYDVVGNRLSSLSVPSYSYNISNELTSTSAATYTYDANGNTLSKSNASGTMQYGWDFENRLRSVITPTGTVSFAYDPFGRRIQKASTQNGITTLTNYLYDGSNSIEEVDSAGNLLARYVQAVGIDEPLSELRSGTTEFYEQDGLGSVTSLSSSTAALTNSYTYDTFGNLAASSGTFVNPYQFTGRDYDTEAGLRYYRARYYAPDSGRFLREDPVYIWSRIPAEMNAFVYTRNRPTTLTDPLGQETGATMVNTWGYPGGGSRAPAMRDDGGINLYGHWCGPGGWGTIINELDGFCRDHDHCYDDIRVSWLNNVGKPLSPQQKCGLKKCDAVLCGHLLSYQPTTRYQRFFVPVMAIFFECLPGMGKNEFLKQVFSF
jgi:RHS repeat-associated protein